MKRRVTTLLILLFLMVGIALPVSAAVKGVEIFDEKGTTYAWVIGEPDMSALGEAPEGCHWEEMIGSDGFQVTEPGQCEFYNNNHTHTMACRDPNTFQLICGLTAHQCDIFCITDNIKYKYVLVEEAKEPILLIVGRGPEGEAILDCEYVFLKQEVKMDQYGDYELDLDGKLQWTSVRVSKETEMNENGVAALHLDNKKLDAEAEYEKLLVGQVLKGDAAETYRPLTTRWQVTVKRNEEGVFQLYSITEAPSVNPQTPADLPQDYWALGEPGFADVANYFDEATKTMSVTNEYYLGTIGVDIQFEGFGSVVPSGVVGSVSILDGPTQFAEKFTKDTTLKNVHMGTYHVVADEVEVEGFALQEIRLQVKAPVEAEPVDYAGQLVLSRKNANAVVVVTYVYEATHQHDPEETVVSPTCTEPGFTLVTCKDPACPYTERKDEVPALGHNYVPTVTEPTCTQPGGIANVCSRCGDRQTQPGADATGHNYIRTENLPTCTENGYILYKCDKCGDSYREPGVAATGHKTQEKVVEPTCTQKGHVLHTCQCGYSYTTDEVPALGHKYTSQVIEPTTQREGYTLHTCQVCGDTYTDNHQDKLNSVTSANPKNTVLARVLDDKDEPLFGSQIALYDGKTKLATWRHTYENLLVLDDLEKYAKEGQSVTYTLKQVKAPEGYGISGDTFTVKITNVAGVTEVDVKKNARATSGTNKGNGIEVGTDGKQVITFRNTRETTRIELFCQVDVAFSDPSWVDEALIEQYRQKQHDFLLTWTDAHGKEQTENVLLAHGEIGLLGVDLPYGTQYTVTVSDPESNCQVTLSETATGTITSKQAKTPITVEAALVYTVDAQQLQLDLVVVDSENKKPLEGASFELRDPDGQAIGTYTSQKSGEILIADVFRQPGEYLLTQTVAPEGYDALKGAVPLTVVVEYAAADEKEQTAQIQSMSVTSAHQAVVAESDGSFWIENTRNGEGDYGNSLGWLLWVVIGGIALLVIAVVVIVVVLIRKKRK